MIKGGKSIVKPKLILLMISMVECSEIERLFFVVIETHLTLRVDRKYPARDRKPTNL